MTSGGAEYVGLRIDVDTLRGTRRGVPALLNVLRKRQIRASIFFSVGPDNMGRHLWRLARPAFLLKMLRSNAASLYGWDILARGVLWPGPRIGEHCASVVQAARDAGHEIGLHAWDHHKWQMQVDRLDRTDLTREIRQGMTAIESIIGEPVTCTAAPGWRCNHLALACKEAYRLRYNSDCRGASPFRPAIDGQPGIPQIPVTLPTYDEVIGRNGVSDDNYNEFLLERIASSPFPILTVHAEVEGIAKRPLFERFLDAALARGIGFRTLGEMLPAVDSIPAGAIGNGRITGREGPVCVQVH